MASSAFVSEALRREVERMRLLASLDAWLDEDPPTFAEVEQARIMLRETFGLSAEEAAEHIPDAPKAPLRPRKNDSR